MDEKPRKKLRFYFRIGCLKVHGTYLLLIYLSQFFVSSGNKIQFVFQNGDRFNTKVLIRTLLHTYQRTDTHAIAEKL